MNLCLLVFLRVLKLYKGRDVVVRVGRTVDIGLDWAQWWSTLLAMQGSRVRFPVQPYIFICVSFYSRYLYFIVYIHSSYSNTFLKILVQKLTIFRVHIWTCNVYDTMHFLLFNSIQFFIHSGHQIIGTWGTI